MVKDNITEIY